MKTSMSNIIFFLAVLSISAISLAKESPVEACIRRNIAQALTPSPSDKPPITTNLKLADELCKDETRIVMYFLELNRRFPRYYLKAMCNVFENDETKVKDYVTTKWLDHSEKLLNSLSCITRTTLVIKKSPLENCIKRNIAEWISPSHSKKTYHLDVIDIIGDDYCRDAGRDIMYFFQLNSKFPAYYVQALCNVFEDEEKKVKEYIMKKWLYPSDKLIDTLFCSSL